MMLWRIAWPWLLASALGSLVSVPLSLLAARLLERAAPPVTTSVVGNTITITLGPSPSDLSPLYMLLGAVCCIAARLLVLRWFDR